MHLIKFIKKVLPFQEVLAKKETILLSSSKKRLIRDLIVVHVFENDKFLKSGKFSKIKRSELESGLIALYGLYMHFTGHGVILPVSKYFFQKG